LPSHEYRGDLLQTLIDNVSRIQPVCVYGRVSAIQGLLVEIDGFHSYLSVGDRCDVLGRYDATVRCEVVGFRDGRALAMPFASLDGIGLGSRVAVDDSPPEVHPDASWLGRVIDGFADPLDGGPALGQGRAAYPIRNSPPPASMRNRVGVKLDLGVRTLNTFLTCCMGQRLGIFAGSGVGKSLLLSMLARYSTADVVVMGLIGERGREVKEFIEEHLGPDGLARSVIVVATSDESALMRRQAAQMTLTVAEYFRDQGKNVLCLLDSVTRFAMAQREIGLSAGEPPASKGYTPTVFAELPKLLERAGPGTGAGSITGIFTVLVEGDDHNEPISDAVRGILDGHVVLDRAIAQRNRFPAINVLQSISRTMPACNSDAENALVTKARRVMAVYDDMAELIRLGAYRMGSDPAVDEAIGFHEPLEAFQQQEVSERTSLTEGYRDLAQILGLPDPGAVDAEPDVHADDAGATAP
jgi:flagellum-specific ATP synthase